MKVVWVGADWDKEKCAVEAACEGEVIRSWVTRTPMGVRRWVSRFDSGTRLVVGIEAGDPLWVRLWERAGAEVYVFDPQKAKRYAQSLSSSGASDDKRSAATLLAQVQSAAHRAKANRSLPPELRGLDRALDTQETIRGEVNRQTNRLNSVLRQVHPALRDVLGSLDRLSVVRLLLAAPTAKAWLELGPADQVKALKGFRQDRRRQLLASLGEDWTGMEGEEEEAARFSVRQIAMLLDVLLVQRTGAERSLKGAARRNPTASMVLGVNGVGPVISSGAAIALAGPENQRDRMAIKTGSAPVTIKSGTRGDAQPNVHMRRSSDTKLRTIAYLMAVQLVLRQGWAKAQYAYYKAKGISGPGAYRRIGRSFSRVLAASVRDQVPFDEARYVERLKAKGVPWALGLAEASTA